MNHMNLEYLESLYNQFKTSPDSVELEWKRFFEGVEFAKDGSLGFSEKELNVYHLISAYRNYGHYEADLDPLTNSVAPSELLSLKTFNLTESDLNTQFQIASIIGKPNATLKEIIAHLKSVYCGKLTVQCAEALPDVRDWFIREFEQNPTNFKLTNEEKKEILTSVTQAESLEKFIHTRYVGTKRFSVEGADAVLPMLDRLTSKGAELKVEEVILGMAHRGRVNVLANYMQKDVAQMFADFNGPTEVEAPIEDFDGDVKYHLGYSKVKKTKAGDVEAHLAFNPSHLEAVNPVVLGMARASQRRRKDTKDRNRVVPVLIHGDAAFAGQGIVMEVFQMAHVRGYNVGGTVHIVIDNQVGFTTNPENGRSAHYSSDVAKVLAIPVIHCNGDDVESCIRAVDIAIRYRQEWKRDIVINMICYRRFGHNEGDEPAYTQPLMYDIIRKHPTLREIYSKQLIQSGACDQAFADSLLSNRMNELQQIYETAKANPPKLKTFKFEGAWKGLKKGNAADMVKPVDTSVDLAALKKVGQLIASVPENFNLHPKLNKLVENRKAMANGTEAVDWGMAELLAYGSLINEGTSVRLTGQDCVRGTFVHRHSGFYDTKTGEVYFPLKQLNSEKTNFCVYDSILSEYAVMGFEYGNSIWDPSFLTMWEAQFGDFGNGAQIMIDQFIAAGESKWQQMSGLVLLLPHGYEGQGPEHSSARLERFLQLAAQNNIQVANLTTPAQIFHALRRQTKRDFRKPLIVMSPKSLLRHPRATSMIDEMAKGSFQEVIADTFVSDAKKIEKVVFVSGKLYYELLEEREKSRDQKTALVRLEQIAPFPADKVAEVLGLYPNAKKLVWAQEEPRNMGSFQFVYFKFVEVLEKLNSKLNITYVGRGERSSPATGSIYRHKVEQQQIIEDVFKV
ncbi:alpha-ketoglutarate decarboxylase [Pseudobdellovibrio exovorus JSS]|uniref:oxoglutarate dehydrogenase (succinyl-transferring) n=2 Tax=Pseudobdellovibrio exovorus TaxID=453816 RepID=M4VDD1_9BACT|nr:alpha-ketoglutarate decarboxylase [Pseudobdellovibrio exovorus JSS]